MKEPATIVVRFTRAGTHRWPDAPDHRAYLRGPHRHLFHFEVSTAVAHDDREIEFHDLLDAAQVSVGRLSGNFGPMSCEGIARYLALELARSFGRPFTVSVFEDGECGATVKS